MKPELIVCLGKVINTDGSLDWIGEVRVQQAALVARTAPQARVLFSGSKSHRESIERPVTEAEAMQAYWEQHFADLPNKVILEQEGLSSIHQLSIIKESFLLNQKLKSIAIVTDELHMPRMEFMIKGMFGPEFELLFSPAKVNVAGKWRSLIEQDENHLLELTKASHGGHAPGDHRAWLKEEEKFRQAQAKHQAAGGSSLQTVVAK